MFGKLSRASATEGHHECHGRHPLFLSLALGRLDELFNEEGGAWLRFNAQDHTLCVLGDLWVGVLLQRGDQGGYNPIEVLV